MFLTFFHIGNFLQWVVGIFGNQRSAKKIVRHGLVVNKKNQILASSKILRGTLHITIQSKNYEIDCTVHKTITLVPN